MRIGVLLFVCSSEMVRRKWWGQDHWRKSFLFIQDLFVLCRNLGKFFAGKINARKVKLIKFSISNRGQPWNGPTDEHLFGQENTNYQFEVLAIDKANNKAQPSNKASFCYKCYTPPPPRHTMLIRSFTFVRLYKKKHSFWNAALRSASRTTLLGLPETIILDRWAIFELVLTQAKLSTGTEVKWCMTLADTRVTENMEKGKCKIA